MNFDLTNTLDLIKDGISETADFAHEKTNEFHEKFVSKITPDFGKYGDAAKFVAEMLPGVSEYNAIKDGDWEAFAIAAGIDIAAVAIGAFSAGAGYAAVKGSTSVAKSGVKVAVKEVAEAGTKKVVKETLEASAEKIAKEVIETSAEKIAKETVEAGVEKVTKEAIETGVEKIAKETVEIGAEKAAKETTETGIEIVSREAVERIKEGGSYKDVKKFCDGAIHEVHHTPAKASSFLDEMDGPAIKMDKFDHQKTASWGNSIEARGYRKMQQELIDSGNFRKAIELDIMDITDKFPGKYDDAIKEMLDYVNKLELEGILK